MLMNEKKLRSEMVNICKRLYDREFITAHDGNISVRIDSERMITTPSGFCKGDVTEEDFIITDMTGKKLVGKYKPSSEIRLHIEAYNQRSDIKAVVHAHPPYAVAFSIAGMTLTDCVLPEVVFTIGSIPTTEYATPTTEEVPVSVRNYIKDHDALILDRHGSLTVGKDIFDAYYKLEKLEHTAKVIYYARNLGNVRNLNKEQIDKLITLCDKFGLKKPILFCGGDGKCPGCNYKEEKKVIEMNNDDKVIEMITKEVIKQINKEK